MPRLDETDPKLILSLRLLMDEYGPKGVYDACAQLINEAAQPQMKAMVQITGDGDYDEPHAYPENADAAQRAYTEDELRNSPYAGTFADAVLAAQDPAPVEVETHEVTPESFDSHDDPPDLRDPDAWENWKHAHGVATGDPNNVGPMGNR